jgi:hypothetical protein
MKSLLSDFDILLNVAGFQNIDQIDRSAIGPFAYTFLFSIKS